MTRAITVEENLSLVPHSSFMIFKAMFVLALTTGILGGCVSSEKYEAEKARALNFQRLLAQEEKRTGELNAKYQEAQRKTSGLESQNRDLSTEMDALREQLTRTQEELARAREGAPSGKKTAGEDMTLSEPSISEFGLEDIEFKDSDFADLGGDMAGDLGGDIGTPMATGTENYHTVVKGDTLYRISKQYGVSVQNLRDWNHLQGNLISVGQKLIVSKP